MTHRDDDVLVRHRPLHRNLGLLAVVTQDDGLVALDLRPRGVVADDRDDRVPHADQRIDLGKGVAAGAVAVDQPDLGARTHRRRADREAAAHAEGSEHPGVEPGQRTTGLDHVRGGGHEVAPIDDQHAVVVDAGLHLTDQRDRVDEVHLFFRHLGDLFVAGRLGLAERAEPVAPATCVR